MVSRIETIDDLVIWLDCIATLDKKNATLEKLQARQISILLQAREIALEIKPFFPAPFKQCCKCKAIYPETKEWFDWCGQGRTGLHGDCKFCRNAYQKKRKNKGRKSPYSLADQKELEDHFGPGAIG